MPASVLAVSDRASLLEGGFDSWLASMAEARVPALLVREKDLADGELLRLLIAARERLRPPTLLMVSGRPDLALAAGLDGVHLPSAGLPIAALRWRWGRGLLVGRSTHSPAEVEAAAREGADYVTFGPVYPTPSKAAFGPPVGLAALERACGHGIPVLALGGVTLHRLPEIAGAGARGFAAIRAFQTPGLVADLVRSAEHWFTPAATPAVARAIR